MKGLLRGIKYMSQVFEVEKEPEMQIGNPTDVKHVAHIGMDGPSTNKPSWMDGFGSELSPSSASNSNQQIKPLTAGNQDSMPPTGNEKKKKSSRRKQSVESSSPAGSPKASEKQSRRHRTSKLSMESPSRDSSSRERPKKSSQEVPDIPKKSRQKKSKGSSGGSEESMSSPPR